MSRQVGNWSKAMPLSFIACDLLLYRGLFYNECKTYLSSTGA